MPSAIHADESPSPFHQAELEIQQRLGVRDKLDAGARRAIRDYMPD